MDKLRHFLYLIGKNFFIPIICCGIISASLVFYLNFCLSHYTELKHRIEFLKQIDYTDIYEATFSLPADENYVEIVNDMARSLKTKAIILNFEKAPIYTTIKKNKVSIIRTISKEEASLYHVFEYTDKRSDGYPAIIPNEFKDKFKIGLTYHIPLGTYVNEMTKEIIITVYGYCDEKYILSTGFGDLEYLENVFLILDSDNTLPIRRKQSNKPVFKVYLHINDYKETLITFFNYDLIKLNKVQGKIDKFSAIKANIIPSYFKFMILGIVLYFLLYINLYILFYYKKKKYIIAFNICNLNKKFYLLSLSIAGIIQLLTGFTLGQACWLFYCIMSRFPYSHHEITVFLLLLLIHMAIIIIFSRRYSYIVRTSH
jgi:hypothetical protein